MLSAAHICRSIYPTQSLACPHIHYWYANTREIRVYSHIDIFWYIIGGERRCGLVDWWAICDNDALASINHFCKARAGKKSNSQLFCGVGGVATRLVGIGLVVMMVVVSAMRYTVRCSTPVSTSKDIGTAPLGRRWCDRNCE